MIRVLVVDDNRLMRKGLRTLLCRAPEILCVGEAGDGDEAVDATGTFSPDVITMDLNMPRTNGIHATKQILARHPFVRIVMVAMSADEPLVEAAIASGAKGYVNKTDMYEELVAAVRAVYDGKRYLSKHVPRPPNFKHSADAAPG